MLQDKRVELDAEKRKKLLDRILVELSRANPDLYYRSTTEIASLVEGHIRGPNLNADDKALLQNATRRDIEVLLSLKN